MLACPLCNSTELILVVLDLEVRPPAELNGLLSVNDQPRRMKLARLTCNGCGSFFNRQTAEIAGQALMQKKEPIPLEPAS